MSVILSHEVRGIRVLEISGRVTVLDRNLREAVCQFLKAGERQFILRMSDVSYMDSCGLGELVSVYTSVRNSGGNIQLLTPSEKVRKLLSITKLDTVFDIFEDAAVY